MKSDIWSMACILAELYTGEMFYSTHENIEHLALIEKACGPIPFNMAEKSTPEFFKLFDFTRSEEYVRQKGMRMDWPRCAKRKNESLQNYDEMLTLNQIF
jgi:hypothetical protein